RFRRADPRGLPRARRGRRGAGLRREPVRRGGRCGGNRRRNARVRPGTPAVTTMARLKAGASIAARYALDALLVYWLVRTDVLDLSPLASMSAGFVLQGVLLGVAVTVLSSWRIQYLLSDQK